MARYSIQIKPSAVNELEALSPKETRQQIISRIRALAETPRPHGCEKLKGDLERYRLRQGPYRIIYSIDDQDLSVLVIKIGHRKEVYR